MFQRFLFSMFFCVFLTSCITLQPDPILLKKQNHQIMVSGFSDLMMNVEIAGVEEKIYDLVDNPRGLILFVPQYHKSPFQAVLNRSNDLSVRIQDEIYQVLESLTANFDVNHIFIEGLDINDAESEEKWLAFLNRLEKLRDDMIEIVNGLSAEEKSFYDKEYSLIKKGTAFADYYVDRIIKLQDASLRVKKKFSQVVIDGAEDMSMNENAFAVMNKSRQAYSHLVYLLAMKNPEIRDSVTRLGMNSSTIFWWPAVRSSLRMMSQKPFAVSETLQFYLMHKSYQNLRSGNHRYIDTGSFLQFSILFKEFEKMIEFDIPEVDDNFQNIYSNITDVDEMLKIYKDLIAEEDKNIFDNREMPVVENMKSQFKNEELQVAVLVFGAGHKKLVPALNKAGFSVITLQTSSVKAEEDKNKK